LTCFTYIAAAHSQVVLAWLLAQPAIDAIVLEVHTDERLQGNLGAPDLLLSGDQIARLNEVSAVDKAFPYRFLELFGSRSQQLLKFTNSHPYENKDDRLY
jgi:diketogulonate reductase-like aldo/keto reductase